jgi:hypothetical protein
MIDMSISDFKKSLIVICEQPHCAEVGQDEQFYCAKCGMELCSVCRFEHMKGYSITGLECDNDICRGTKEQCEV